MGGVGFGNHAHMQLHAHTMFKRRLGRPGVKVVRATGIGAGLQRSFKVQHATDALQSITSFICHMPGDGARRTDLENENGKIPLKAI